MAHYTDFRVFVNNFLNFQLGECYVLPKDGQDVMIKFKKNDKLSLLKAMLELVNITMQKVDDRREARRLRLARRELKKWISNGVDEPAKEAVTV